MAKKFHYTRIGQALRPIIPITLKNADKQLRYIALIDSGADFCIFHADIAVILTINYKLLSRKDFGGIGGTMCKGYIGVIEIGLGDTFFETPVIFSPDIGDYGYGILGQVGFFDKLKITFNYKAQDIFIQ